MLIVTRMNGTIDCIYKDFRNNCKIEGAIIYKLVSMSEFKISIQCNSQNINVDTENQSLYFLCEK